MSADGRFAPSPTGPLHLGSLRTALVAWLMARSRGGRFLVRIEDLDPQRSRREFEDAQLRDLRALGIDWDAPPVRQSERTALYADAVTRLGAAGHLYPCFCTRAEIREAASAPHGNAPVGGRLGGRRVAGGRVAGGRVAGGRVAGGRVAGGRVPGGRAAHAALPADAYPGTCRAIPEAVAEARIAAGERFAWRLAAAGAAIGWDDRLLGPRRGRVDDFVVVRSDGVHAYQLAVVVDDAAQGIGEVVRGADLADSTPRQILLQRLLGLPTPSYAHVPLVLGPDGRRLAKRDAGATLAQRREPVERTLTLLASSLGLRAVGPVASAADLLGGFDPALIPPEPLRLH